MGKRNGKKNGASKTSNGDRNNKRRVSFNLSSEHTHRHSYTSVANSNGSSDSSSSWTRPRQTWLQTIMLSGALLFTLPKLMHRLTSVYCYKDGSLQCDGFVKERLCTYAKVAIERYQRHVPYSHLFLGVDNTNADAASSIQETAETTMENDTTAKKGIFKRVVDRHRQQRDKKKQRRDSSKQHPLHHLLEGAYAFSHWKKQHKQQQQQQLEIKDNKDIEVDWNKWKYAMSDDFQLTSHQTGLIKELAKRVLLKAKLAKSMSSPSVADESITAVSTKGFAERVDSVPWGGVSQSVTKWWPRKDNNQDRVSTQSEGARLLAAYLKIMKWPKDLHAKFPFKLCPKGCDSEVAVLHTLEWREKYRPWCMSPNAIQYNKAGFIYHRGHSRAGPRQRKEAENTKDAAYISNVGHSMVWYHPRKASLDDPELYIRALINTLEAAVADSLLRNNGEIGRFNLVIDCEGVGTKSIPSMTYIKKLFAFLQDHFPDRLGVLLLANLSGVGRMVMNIVMPFVTEDVKAKIHVIPSEEIKRQEMITQFIDLQYVPKDFGGKDVYVFDANEYYYGSLGGSLKCVLTENDIREYILSMPYHA